MKLRIKGVAAASLMLSMVLGSGLDASARAKYVFYFIGDGMGMGHVNAAETYLRDVVKSGEGLLMLDFPVASQVRTYSANSPITDSAAAGTALSTGSKTNNHRIARSPEGEDLYSISRDFMRAEYEVGVATTVAGDDATPAAFYAHADDRGQKEVITPMAVGSGLRFLGGGNFKGITDKEGNTKAYQLGAEYARKGYVVVSGLALGCDAAAHRGCLDVKGGTIAIVGNGLDITHPRENKALEESILRNGGLLLSEQTIGVKANPTRLVARNRLQAALSQAVILAQCPAQSGSLHTMRFARKYRKESLAAIFTRRTDANVGNYDLIEQNLAKPI